MLPAVAHRDSDHSPDQILKRADQGLHTAKILAAINKVVMV